MARAHRRALRLRAQLAQNAAGGARASMTRRVAVGEKRAFTRTSVEPRRFLLRLDRLLCVAACAASGRGGMASGMRGGAAVRSRESFGGLATVGYQRNENISEKHRKRQRKIMVEE